MRLLVSRRRGIPLGRATHATLDELYAYPRGRRWLRVNFVSTIDGSAVGADGRSGSINTPPDNQVFSRLRTLCDVVLVGAGTARDEGYGPARKPIAVISGAGHLPQGLADARKGRTILITSESSGRSASDDVWLCGKDSVDLGLAVERLAKEGMPRILCEGGPHLFSSLLSAGLVDDVAVTVSPMIVGGEGTRMTHGPLVDAPVELRHVLEEDSTLLMLWRVRR